MIKNLISDCHIYHVNTIFILFIILLYFNACALNKPCQPNNNECLKVRIDQFYSYVIDGRYGKSWTLFSAEERRSKKEYIEFASKFKLKVNNYVIESISIDNHNARVKMIVSGVENNITYTTVSIDCWAYNDGNWYLKTGGRVSDWICK